MNSRGQKRWMFCKNPNYEVGFAPNVAFQLQMSVAENAVPLTGKMLSERLVCWTLQTVR
jgi:hypothetical protein